MKDLANKHMVYKRVGLNEHTLYLDTKYTEFWCFDYR